MPLQDRRALTMSGVKTAGLPGDREGTWVQLVSLGTERGRENSWSPWQQGWSGPALAKIRNSPACYLKWQLGWVCVNNINACMYGCCRCVSHLSIKEHWHSESFSMSWKSLVVMWFMSPTCFLIVSTNPNTIHPALTNPNTIYPTLTILNTIYPNLTTPYPNTIYPNLTTRNTIYPNLTTPNPNNIYPTLTNSNPADFATLRSLKYWPSCQNSHPRQDDACFTTSTCKSCSSKPYQNLLSSIGFPHSSRKEIF